MKDIAAVVLAFMFAENKKEHPMPSQRKETLFQKIRNLIQKNEENSHG